MDLQVQHQEICLFKGRLVGAHYQGYGFDSSQMGSNSSIIQTID